MFIKYEERFDFLDEKKDIIPETLSSEQAIEDLNQCVYLIETSCASFVEQKDNIDFQNRYQKIFEELKKSELIKTDYFLMSLLGKLTSGIKDLHSNFQLKIEKDNKIYSYYRYFVPRCISYTSSILFTKKDNKYIAEDNPSYILEGAIINQKTKIEEKSQLYFVPVLIESKVLYKAAKFFSLTTPEDADFFIGGKNIEFVKQDFNLQKSWNILQNKYIDSKDSVYFIMPDYLWSNEIQDNYYDWFHNSISEIRKKKNLIIDNRHNSGGMPYRQLKILCELFGHDPNLVDRVINREINNDEDILEGRCLLSNPIVQKEIESTNNSGEWKYKTRLLDFYKKELVKLCKGKSRWSNNENIKGDWNKLSEKISYTGKIFLIIDSNTASLGEQLYFILKEDFGYKNITLIGTNSSGCISYGNPFVYFLKNSGIGLQLSSRTEGFESDIFVKEYIEARGLIPDYWATNDIELCNTLSYLCK